MDDGRIDRLAAEYRRFSDEETPGRSALYAEITREIARDRDRPLAWADPHGAWLRWLG